jgi:hypothetical protein
VCLFPTTKHDGAVSEPATPEGPEGYQLVTLSANLFFNNKRENAITFIKPMVIFSLTGAIFDEELIMIKMMMIIIIMIMITL